MESSRRRFLRNTSLLAAAGLAAPTAFSAELENAATEPAQTVQFQTPSSTRHGDMLYRKLGSTGESVSIVGVGGAHIGLQKDADDSIRIIRTAIDRGVTFMDNSCHYHNGDSERRMGRALQDGYREKVFLMTKIDGRTHDSAARQIDGCLQRLATDHIDLMQFHEIIQLDAPDRIFSDGGAWEAMQAAQKAGKVRYIGFTGHKDPFVHMRMLDTAQQHGVHFDAVQMPVNIMDAHFRSFTYHVLPRLLKENIGPLAMKPFGGQIIVREVLRSGVATPIELLHYVMSLPVAVVITGIDSLKILNQALEAVRTFQPLTPDQRTALAARVNNVAQHGKFERYKTSAIFDGTAKNPAWLEG
jgi:aryl-alcohol dehydrogenase-like predicted oxidoreductase